VNDSDAPGRVGRQAGLAGRPGSRRSRISCQPPFLQETAPHLKLDFLFQPGLALPMDSAQIRLFAPDSPAHWDETRTIFLEYARSLSVNLSFQDFDAELAALPGQYANPHGRVLLATVDGAFAACGAFRPRPDVDYPNACEMKRLFVRPGFRRCGLGRRMAQALIDEAGVAGYSSMLLDTLDDMESARDLYASLGFSEIPPYYFNPVPGAHYLKVDLAWQR